MMFKRNYACGPWSLSFGLVFLCLTCSQNNHDTSITLKIEKPYAHSLDEFSFQTFEQIFSEPTSLNEITCIGVLAGHSDGIDNKGVCETSDSGNIPVARWAGLAPYISGQQRSLQIAGLKPKASKIGLVGFKKIDGTSSCDSINADFEPDEMGYSDPYLLGIAELNLNPGPNTTNIAASFVSTSTVEDCDDSIWGSPTLNSRLEAFWNFDEADAFSYSLPSFGSINLDWYSTKTNLSPAKIQDGKQISNAAYISTDSNSTFIISGGEDVSFSAWFKATGASNTPGHMLLDKFNSGTFAGYSVDVTTTEEIRLRIGNGSNVQTFQTGLVFSTTSWQMITFSVRNRLPDGKVKICLNTSCYEQTITSTIVDAPIDLIIGQLDTSTAGGIDALGVWSRYLDQADIEELYNNGAGRQYPFY